MFRGKPGPTEVRAARIMEVDEDDEDVYGPGHIKVVSGGHRFDTLILKR